MKMPTLKELDLWEPIADTDGSVIRLLAAARQRIRLVELVKKAIPMMGHERAFFSDPCDADCPACALRREVEEANAT